MANDRPDADDDDPTTLRLQYSMLRRQYYQAIPPATRNQREVSELRVLATWALRSGLGGWAIVRQGALKSTNRAFDALDRHSVIGPGWHEMRRGDSRAPEIDGHGQSLAEIAVSEARQLLANRQRERSSRYVRGAQVVAMTVEQAGIGDGNDPLVLVHVRDITDVTQSEARLAELQDRLRQREQVARAGEVAVEVGHDLGNLVGAMSARLMVLEAEGQISPASLAALKGIVDAQAALVGRVKAMAGRRAEEPLQRLSLLNDLVMPAVQILEGTLQPPGKSPVWVRVDAQVGQLPAVHGPRDALLNLIMNLIVNARDAMPTGGVIQFHGQVQDGALVLAVNDQGTGIPEQHLPRIFEPFFTTKSEHGMGMGLAMARQLMRRLGGDITARNRPEGGACFELRFPADGA